jgi:hypothetical protein
VIFLKLELGLLPLLLLEDGLHGVVVKMEEEGLTESNGVLPVGEVRFSR